MSVYYVSDVIKMDLGEERHIRVEVKPECEQDLPFVVSKAWYELRNVSEDYAVEETGECTIEEHVLDILISPLNAVTYQLKFFFQISDETWVSSIKVKVGE